LSLLPKAEMMITGISEVLRNLASISSPSITGIMRSSRMMSGFFSRAVVSPTSPFRAERTAYPLFSRFSESNLTMMGSSSTSSTVVILPPEI
jgi:hypothetical protein